MQRSGSGGMNLSVEDSFEPTTQCSTPVPRAAKGVISVDVGPRVYTDVDLKLKSGSKEYSPVQKTSKPPARQAVSRIHAIPFLMLVVFVLLWAGSTSGTTATFIPPPIQVHVLLLSLLTFTVFVVAGDYSIAIVRSNSSHSEQLF